MKLTIGFNKNKSLPKNFILIDYILFSCIEIPPHIKEQYYGTRNSKGILI